LILLLKEVILRTKQISSCHLLATVIVAAQWVGDWFLRYQTYTETKKVASYYFGNEWFVILARSLANTVHLKDCFLHLSFCSAFHRTERNLILKQVTSRNIQKPNLMVAKSEAAYFIATAACRQEGSGISEVRHPT